MPSRKASRSLGASSCVGTGTCCFAASAGADFGARGFTFGFCAGEFPAKSARTSAPRTDGDRRNTDNFLFGGTEFICSISSQKWLRGNLALVLQADLQDPAHRSEPYKYDG